MNSWTYFIQKHIMKINFAGALQVDPSIDKDDKALMVESFPIAEDKARLLH
jgi:hypothetical protein